VKSLTEKKTTPHMPRNLDLERGGVVFFFLERTAGSIVAGKRMRGCSGWMDAETHNTYIPPRSPTEQPWVLVQSGRAGSGGRSLCSRQIMLRG
jgi:hypothetical protein